MTHPTPAQVELVVVGASAGGVSALRQLVGALPADFVPPVVIVLHLPRDRPSLLVDVLRSVCALPVAEAVDKQALVPGRVYVAPPDYHLLVEDRGSLALSVDEPVLFSRPSIDVLFESAADAFGADVLAILLTGASADGSRGVAAIRAAGGSAWIQDPGDAEASFMPASAIAHAGADAVLTLDRITRRLADLK
ncbi:chemotaxis protein CheB [Cognatilysobacter segetis]|uniref:chemotaxis protein CheB n=1 Tax=Cognatilysobacter segetis TaxID=2492394 RepID=UPI00105E0985|nr:chemotaxis protein CheB [Lysobacter segetis]